MQSLINKLQKRRVQLSELETQVFDYIVRNPQKIEQMTAEQLAQELFISTATISRTAKHLGFKGFQELKYAIAQYSQVEKGSEGTVTASSDINQLTVSIETQLHATFEQLKKAPIAEVVDLIAKSRSIEIMGVGGSLPICIDTARKLTFMGKNASARIDWDELQAVSKSLTPEDLAIIVSNSGETIHVVEYANNLKANKVPFIAIVGTKDSHLEKMATYTLQAIVEMIYEEDVDLSSRVSLLAMLDILLIRVAEKIK